MLFSTKTLPIAGLLTGLLLAATNLAYPALAADPTEESITLTPVSKRFELDAGSSVQDAIKVINGGQMAYDFIVYSRPYAIINSNYDDPQFSDAAVGVLNADAYKWVQFEKTKYRIEPGKEVDVPFTLNVPQNAAPGGHYGVIFAEVQSEAAGMIGRNKRVGSVVYATVNGEFQQGAEVSKPNIPFFQVNPPMEAGLSVKNTGNTHFTATTTYKVLDVFGNQKHLAQAEYAVLPQTTRSISLKWDDSPSFGLFVTEVEAKALDEQTFSREYVFMAPFWFYGVIAVLIAGGVLYALARRK